MSVFKDLFWFFHSNRTWEGFFSLWYLAQIRSIFYVIVLLYILIISFFFPDLINDLQPKKLQEFVLWEPLYYVVLLTVILGPLVEELLFRAWLKWWWRNISRLLWAILFAGVKYILHINWIQFADVSQAIRSLIGYAIYVLCVILVFHSFKPFFPSLSRIHRKYAHFIFWLSAICFGLVHIGNYEFVGINYWVIAMIVPQIILWIMLWFVRLRAGLWTSIGVHMFHNTIQIIPILLLKLIPWAIDTLTYTPGMHETNKEVNIWIILQAIFFFCVFMLIIWSCYKEVRSLFFESTNEWKHLQ